MFISSFACGDDEKTEPTPEAPVCGDLVKTDGLDLNFEIDRTVPDRQLFTLGDSYEDSSTTTVTGLPPGVTLVTYWQTTGYPTEVGTFTVVVDVVSKDAACPAIESITQTITVVDRPLNCDDDRDCNLLFNYDDGCTDNDSCMTGDNCFSVMEGLTTCLPFSQCGDGTRAIDYDRVDGTEFPACLEEGLPSKCNERNHCLDPVE